MVGEQYLLIVEADRLNQFNQCGFGYAVTGGWSFTIASVTVGLIDDNVVMENDDNVISQKKFLLYDKMSNQ